jgi:succinyl-diaminopimelate desuccinylase
MDTVELTEALIRRPSVTPNDAGCQELIADRLTELGFTAEHMRFGDVSNLWARRGKDRPVLVFAGHTDVVPPGEPSAWLQDPFTPLRTRDGCLVGRGAADMKASLAAMVTAIGRFVALHPDHAGSIAFLLTSDEEGPADDGTIKVMETLSNRGELFDYCVVGEPSSDQRLGDTLRFGRRGSLSGIMTILSAQAHVAYPPLRENPMHALARFVSAMCTRPIDSGNSHFPPTTFQMVNVHSDAGAPNVVPGELKCRFNFRYNTQWTHATLKAHVESTLKSLGIDYEIRWRVAGEPFITEPGKLTETVSAATEEVTGIKPVLSTSGGTSDGRFIAPYGVDVVELGPINKTIHQVNEEVRIEDIYRLEEIYLRIATKLLT